LQEKYGWFQESFLKHLRDEVKRHLSRDGTADASFMADVGTGTYDPGGYDLLENSDDDMD
jgi:hypothetical protein